METSAKSISGRFVIEDSITRVTSDGEPHEMMTLIAIGSGLIAAIIVLIIVVSLIGNRNESNENEEDDETTLTADSPSIVIPIFNSTPRCDHEPRRNQPKLISISSISESIPSPEGEINLALRDSFYDPQPGPSGLCVSRL